MILGFNSNLSNTPYTYTLPDFINKYQKSGSRYIRFPGGTVANMYNWKTGLLKGFKGMPGKFVKNIKWRKKRYELFGISYQLDNFLFFLSKTKTNFSIVLNIFSLTPAENAAMLSYIKEKGFTVKYIEIGNEIYGKAYKSIYPTVASYMNTAEYYAKAAKQVFPQARIGITIPPALYLYNINGNQSGLTKWQRKYISESITWYTGIQKYDFYDAVIIHLYNRITWTEKKDIKTFYTESLSKSNDRIITRTFNTLQSYFPEKTVWITEWNSGLNQWLDERYETTFAKALYTADFIRKMLLQKQVFMAGLHAFPYLLIPRSLKETNNKRVTENTKLMVTPKFHVFELLNKAISDSTCVSAVTFPGGKNRKTKGKNTGSFRTLFLGRNAELSVYHKQMESKIQNDMHSSFPDNKDSIISFSHINQYGNQKNGGHFIRY